MVPSRSAVGSRLDVDLATTDGSGATIPIVTANMTAVSGRRMAETVARRGGIAILPQDIPADVVADVIAWVKSRDLVVETALTLAPTDTAGDALSLLPKRAHGAVIVLSDERPVGVVTEADCLGVDRFTQLSHVMSADPFTLPAGTPPEQAFALLHDGRHRLAPVVDGEGRCLGIMTRTGALRATLYSPAVDAAGRRRGPAPQGRGAGAGRRGLERDDRLMVRRDVRVPGRHVPVAGGAAVQGELRDGVGTRGAAAFGQRLGVRAGPEGAVRGGHLLGPDVPGPGAARRGGPDRHDRGRAPLLVQLRGRT